MHYVRKFTAAGKEIRHPARCGDDMHVDPESRLRRGIMGGLRVFGIPGPAGTAFKLIHTSSDRVRRRGFIGQHYTAMFRNAVCPAVGQKQRTRAWGGLAASQQIISVDRGSLLFCGSRIAGTASARRWCRIPATASRRWRNGGFLIDYGGRTPRRRPGRRMTRNPLCASFPARR